MADIENSHSIYTQYPRINYFGNLWRYHGFTDIDARYPCGFSFCVWWCDIQELVIFDDDWHLNILLILLILSTFPHSSSVLHAIWWYRSYFSNWWCDDIQHFLIILLLMTSTINPFYDDIQLFSIFMCLTISRIFRFIISFPLIYLDCVHFRPFLIIRLMSFAPSISPIWA